MSRQQPLLKLVLSRGLVENERIARSLIMQGRVLVGGEPVTGPGTAVSVNAAISLIEKECPYVSRGGLKLKNCLEELGDDAPHIRDAVCVDLGSSTGGFTEVLLAAGAARVYAVDVGVGQLDGRLRGDSRVVVLEGVNARDLTPQQVPEPCDVFTVDVSFISGVWLLQFIAPLLAKEAQGLLLLKPQFERAPEREDERRGWFVNGVVRHPELHRRVLRDAYVRIAERGFAVRNLLLAQPAGAKGNREFFLRLVRDETGLADSQFKAAVDGIL